VATVNKNFRVKNGLVVEGSTATVGGYDVLTKTSADQSYIIDLIGGTATSANTPNTVVKRDASGNFSAGTITATFSGNLTGNVTGTVSDISNHDTGDLAEGTNLYFTNQRALDATSAAYDAAGAASAAQTAAQNYADGLAVNYDAAGSASAAQTAAQNYADGLVNGLDTDDIEEGASNLYFTNGRARNAMGAGTGLSYDTSTGTFSVTANTYDAYGAASAAEAAANSYTDAEIDALSTTDIEEGTNLYYTDTRARGAVSAGSGLNYNGGTGEFSVDTSVIANKSYVDTAISNLVDGAPELLNTLNEIAAAINDDANYFTTIANGLAAKLDLAGGTLTGALTLNADPVNALEAATKQYVDTAESDAVSSANSYTDQAILDGNAVAEPVYAAIDFNGVAKNVAATVSVPTASTVTAYEWNHSGFKSGKFTVKVANGTHTELSEILITTDTSNNVHMTEYGMVGTNGSLSTISADFDTNKIRVRVTTLNNNSTVVVAGTLIQ
jgi:hypothetical protein